jgi:hypothetical protein
VKRAYAFAAELESGGKFSAVPDGGVKHLCAASDCDVVSKHIVALQSALTKRDWNILKAAQGEVKQFLHACIDLQTY